MPTNLIAEIEERVAHFQATVEANSDGWGATRSPEAFRQAELDIARHCRGLQDAITEAVLRSIIGDTAFQAETSVAARQDGQYRDGGRRDVTVRLLGGTAIRLEAMPYLKENRRRPALGRPRRRRGQRAVNGTLYPSLCALGIAFGTTPALAGEICYQVTESESVRTARAALARRGIDLGHKQTLRLVNAYGQRAVEQRDAWIEQAVAQPSQPGPLTGQRVVVATDGGRLRERLYPRSGRRRKNGHRRYDTPWREPKLLVIYVINAQGQVIDTYRPIYDATLRDADAIFAMLLGYLKALGGAYAQQLIVVADGAKWIWERVTQLVSDLGLDPDRVHEVIDWYHVTEKLHEVANIPTDWLGGQRQQWLTQAERLLHRGNIDALLAQMESLVIDHHAFDVRNHEDYFRRNSQRMQYQAFKRLHIPRGSGAVESAVRRVINLRMKSPGSFWREQNAESMLLFRSYLRAGRFDDLFAWSISVAVPWHVPAAAISLFPSSSKVISA